MSKSIDPEDLEIIWNRLIYIVDEADLVLVKASFSTIIRDAHDYTCAILDSEGNLLAQSTHTTPGLLGGMLLAVKTLCREFQQEAIEEGDSFITNDPWTLSGHLPDILIVAPIFYRKKLIGFAGSVVHHLDIGGRLGCENREIFEEGLRIPLCKLYKNYNPNEEIFNIIRANNRVPDKVIGDIRAQIAANDTSLKRLTDLLEEYGLKDLKELSKEIISRSEANMRAAIKGMPDGTYPFETFIEGMVTEKPIKIKVSIEVSGDEITVDYEGTDPQIDCGINCVYNFNYAYTVYAIKCAINPDVPNNEGFVRPIKVKAPKGSIVNAEFPAPVMGRTGIAHMLSDIVLQALSSVIPDKIIASSGAAPIWYFTFSGEHKKKLFVLTMFLQGGLGSRPTKDGVSCLSFPYNVTNTPMEILESDTPLLCEKKELIPDSGGPGKFRGGCGQEIIFKIARKDEPSPNPVLIAILAGRLEFPPEGLRGGMPGSVGKLLLNGQSVNWGRHFLTNYKDSMTFCLPGGGGFYNPLERDIDCIVEDVKNGLVSVDSARRDYGVILDEKSFEVELAATKELRKPE